MNGTPKKMCFVVQGFGEKTDYRTGRKLNLDASYDVVKEAVENAGLTCIRADEIQHSGIIDKPMYESILEADLVIADLSTSNINAAYELGVRHAVRPRSTIIISEKQWDFPFDIDHTAIRTYEHLGPDIGRQEAKRFSSELTKAIKSILAAQDAVDSPLYTFVPGLRPPGYPVQANASEESQRESQHSPSVGTSCRGFTDQGKSALQKGDFVTAKVMYNAAHEIRPNDESIMQKLVLATYKSKKPSEKEALEEALELVRKNLLPNATNDPETIGLWGAIHKRLWQLTKKNMHLLESIDALERGFKLQKNYYNGINLAFMLNERAAQEGTPIAEAIADYVQARRIRLEVIELCKAVLNGNGEDNDNKYWLLATIWEACVGTDNEKGVEKWMSMAKQYAEANKLPEWMMDSTKEQILKLRALLQPSPLSHISD